MGHKSSKAKGKQILKVLVLGVSGSGKSTFIKQMKIIHKGGFTQEETEQYKAILFQNVVIGLQELLKQANKSEIQLEEKSRKYARSIQALSVGCDFKWDDKLQKQIVALWADNGIQQAWKESHNYQLQVQHMDFLMENMERLADPSSLPTHEDILLARQRTTGSYRTTIKQDKNRWELIDVGGQIPERKKWEDIISEGPTAIIFFAGLDEYNMTSAEDKDKTKMQIAMEVFKEMVNALTTKGISKLLFLNKIDLFKKKMEDPKMFQAFQQTFPHYRGDNNADKAAAHVSGKFADLLDAETEQLHTHVVCALDTSAMSSLFEAVRDDIFLKKMDIMASPSL